MMKRMIFFFISINICHSVVCMTTAETMKRIAQELMAQSTHDQLLKTVLFESGKPATGEQDEIIEICSQPQRIIHNYTPADDQKLIKDWRGIKMIGYEFRPLQSTKEIADSDEADSIYEYESIMLNFSDQKNH